MSRRGAVGVAVLILWALGFGLLARRRAMQPESERLAAGAVNVQPGSAYFEINQGSEKIGWASAHVDTTVDGIRVAYRAAADVPVGGRLQRASVENDVLLSRRFVMRTFKLLVRWQGGTFRLSGKPAGDSALTLLTTTAEDAPDTLQLRTTGGLLFPTLVPLAFAIGGKPAVGQVRTIKVFDPTAMGERELRMRVQKAGMFTVYDSAVFDPASKRWQNASPVQVRAWKLVPADSISRTVAWVDDQGQLVQFVYPGGFVLNRAPYEVAYENWRADAAERPRQVTADRDILESTAIAANTRLGTRAYEQMKVRLSGVDLSEFSALPGDRQSFAGGVLTVDRETAAAQAPGYTLPLADSLGTRFRAELAAEPLVESTRPEITELSARIVGGERDPHVAAQLIARWVHDSLAKDITFGLPDAVQVLRARRGDCNEHTALYLALARAAGLPARSAAGLAFVSGKFYYHAWPEVWLGRWVAVDPTFGEFPADASHLRFVVGGLDQQATLLRLIGALRIDVIAAR